jgi:hypothetical protein
MTKLLEKAIAKARELSAEDQDAVAVAMLSMAEETPVVALDEETRAAIREGLEQAGASSCRKRKLKPSGSGTVYEASLYAARA